MTRPALALLLTGLALAAPVPKEKAKAVPYPTAVGTKWEYIHEGGEKQLCVEEISEETEKDGVVTIRVDIKEPKGTKTFESFEIKGGEVWCLVSSGIKCDPPMLMYRTGAKEGDTWKNDFKLGCERVKETVTVGKAEEITTPAGTFSAVPVVHVDATGDGSPSYTGWFVEGVGLVRHTVDGMNTPIQELKAFTPAKGKK